MAHTPPSIEPVATSSFLASDWLPHEATALITGDHLQREVPTRFALVLGTPVPVAPPAPNEDISTRARRIFPEDPAP